MPQQKRRNLTCYLCGQPGADSKDHVPPKAFLPPIKAGFDDRLTVPAHRKCNSAYSHDEEYVRDLLLPEALYYEFDNSDLIMEKIYRAWQRPAGVKRHQNLTHKARTINVRSPAGLYLGQAVALELTEDKVERINRVAKKIIQGIIFYDAGAITATSDIHISSVKTRNFSDELKQEMYKPFRERMCQETCLHSHFAPNIALRRLYEVIPDEEDKVLVVAWIVVVLWNTTFLTMSSFNIELVTNRKLKFIGYRDFWQENPHLSDHEII